MLDGKIVILRFPATIGLSPDLSIRPMVSCLLGNCFHCTTIRHLHPIFTALGSSRMWRRKNPDVPRCGSPGIRKSGFLKIRFLKIRIIRHSDFPDFPENRNIQKSGKKASDVEFAYVELPLLSRVILSFRSRWAGLAFCMVGLPSSRHLLLSFRALHVWLLFESSLASLGSPESGV